MRDGQMTGNIQFPTVDDWWELTRRFPEFRRYSNTPLKDFGYLRILEFLADRKPRRVLEFGHGLGHSGDSTLYNFSEQVEMWGVDDCQDLAYFPKGGAWEKAYAQYIARFPKVKFVRALLGDPQKTKDKIPEGYFDMVCSVSVLEEVSREELLNILGHCYVLLAPGGHLLFTHDTRVGDAKRVRRVVRLAREAGFRLKANWWHLRRPGWRNALLENQFMVMLQYQAGDRKGENRSYKGNWTTFVVDAVKA